MSRPAAGKSAPRPPVRLARDQRVGDILQAARTVFCEKGYEPTAVSEIAARIGVVEGTIYKYFDSKRALLLQVLEHWYEEMFGDCARILAGVSGTHARLRLLVWRHLRTVRDYPLLCRLMFREVRSEQDYHGSGLHAMNRRYTRFLMDVIGEGVAAGEFRSDIPVTLLRDMVYGGIEHHSWNFVCGRGTLDIDRVADQITAVVSKGIAAATEPSVQSELQRLSARVARMTADTTSTGNEKKSRRPRS